MIEGAGVRSVQIASQGAGSPFYRVHHQRGAEPYTFGRGGMRAVEVDFRGDTHAQLLIATKIRLHYPLGHHPTEGGCAGGN